MKLTDHHAPRTTHDASRRNGRQRGSAVIIIMALIALILVYVAANVRTLSNLGRELRLLERQQTMRLKHLAPKTNAPPAVSLTTNLTSSSSAH